MRFLLSAALAACFVTPALASPAAIVNDGHGHLRIWNSHQPSLRHSLHDPAGPPCFTAAAAMADVKRAAGETVAELKGDDAEALLAGINHLGARPTWRFVWMCSPISGLRLAGCAFSMPTPIDWPRWNTRRRIIEEALTDGYSPYRESGGKGSSVQEACRRLSSTKAPSTGDNSAR